uniref:Putative LOC101236095 [Hydra vulgaris] n=1 Tax=Lepeophtheirus salmonis TaxID=72036 RepID=A0A0K2TNP6_LEPSM
MLVKIIESFRKNGRNNIKRYLMKLSHQLWYFTNEAAALSFFNDDVDQEAKEKMVINFKNKNISGHGTRYVTSNEGFVGSWFDKKICYFNRSKKWHCFPVSKLKIILFVKLHLYGIVILLGLKPTKISILRAVNVMAEIYFES